MKKLKLNPSAFNKCEVLTRAQLKKIMGGQTGSGGGCQVLLYNTPSGGSTSGGMYWGEGGHSYDKLKHGPNGTVISGVSYDDAQQAVSNGGRWCCDSCGSASWSIK